MTFTINGEEVEGRMSVLTFVIYEQEFGGADLVQDVNGKVLEDDLSPEKGVLFDFTRTEWGKVMQAVWAMVKTADDKVPHYRKWAAGVDQVNMFDLQAILAEAMSDTFFHPAPSNGEGAE